MPLPVLWMRTQAGAAALQGSGGPLGSGQLYSAKYTDLPILLGVSTFV